jgi:hypothetical protein
MADNLAKMEARIRELEAQREKGKDVPELDRLYKQMDSMTKKAHKEATEYEDTMRLRKAVRSGIEGKPNNDRINMDTYVPGFEKGRTIDTEEGMKGLKEAENELKRETSRGGKDTSLRGKIREITGMKKGGAVKSASARADGCAIRGKTRA